MKPQNCPWLKCIGKKLELHHVRVFTVLKGERNGKVLSHKRVSLLDSLDDGGVDGLLISDASLGDLSLLSLRVEESLLALLHGVVSLLEILVVELLNVDLNVELSRGSDASLLVDTTEGNTVDLVGAYSG